MTERRDLIDAAMTVFDAPDCAGLFDGKGLSEVPIAGVVDGVVVSGTIDRLSVFADRVECIEFKTGRRGPSAPDNFPETHVRQMAAYVAVLRGVFPGRHVRGVLVYTAGPRLFVLDDALLELNKPGLPVAQPIFAIDG